MVSKQLCANPPHISELLISTASLYKKKHTLEHCCINSFVSPLTVTFVLLIVKDYGFSEIPPGIETPIPAEDIFKSFECSTISTILIPTGSVWEGTLGSLNPRTS